MQDLPDSGRLATHRPVDTDGDAKDWHRAAEEAVRRLPASMPHGGADFWLGQAEYMRRDESPEEAAGSYGRAW